MTLNGSFWETTEISFLLLEVIQTDCVSEMFVIGFLIQEMIQIGYASMVS